ncbi:MAG: hypothetical protein II718_06950 [Clostridiales bacterium]|nr:hypothetical protein [Clostridiales bacterium]
MKTFKRAGTVLVVLLMALSLFSCSKDTRKKDRKDREPSSDPEKPISLPIDEDEHVIFYEHSCNYAWGAYEYGRCITNKCNVYEFSDYDRISDDYLANFDFCIGCLSPSYTLEEDFVNDMYELACDLDPSAEYIEDFFAYDAGDSYYYFVTDDGQSIQFMNEGCYKGSLKGAPDELLGMWQEMFNHIETSYNNDPPYDIYSSSDCLRSWTVSDMDVDDGKYSFDSTGDLLYFLTENNIPVSDEDLQAIEARDEYLQYNGKIFLDIDSNAGSLQSVFFVDEDNRICYFDHMPGAFQTDPSDTVISIYMWNSCWDTSNPYEDPEGVEWAHWAPPPAPAPDFPPTTDGSERLVFYYQFESPLDYHTCRGFFVTDQYNVYYYENECWEYTTDRPIDRFELVQENLEPYTTIDIEFFNSLCAEAGNLDPDEDYPVSLGIDNGNEGYAYYIDVDGTMIQYATYGSYTGSMDSASTAMVDMWDTLFNLANDSTDYNGYYSCYTETDIPFYSFGVDVDAPCGCYTFSSTYDLLTYLESVGITFTDDVIEAIEAEDQTLGYGRTIFLEIADLETAFPRNAIFINNVTGETFFGGYSTDISNGGSIRSVSIAIAPDALYTDTYLTPDGAEWFSM